jgi:hypothetical protein
MRLLDMSALPEDLGKGDFILVHVDGTDELLENQVRDEMAGNLPEGVRGMVWPRGYDAASQVTVVDRPEDIAIVAGVGSDPDTTRVRFIHAFVGPADSPYGPVSTRSQ